MSESTFALQMTTEVTAQTHLQIQYRVLVSSGRVKISLEAQTLLVQHSPGQRDTDHTNLQTDKGYLCASGWLLALLSGLAVFAHPKSCCAGATSYDCHYSLSSISCSTSACNIQISTHMRKQALHGHSRGMRIGRLCCLLALQSQTTTSQIYKMVSCYSNANAGCDAALITLGSSCHKPGTLADNRTMPTCCSCMRHKGSVTVVNNAFLHNARIATSTCLLTYQQLYHTDLWTKHKSFLQKSVQAVPCATALLQQGCLVPDVLLAGKRCHSMLVDGAGNFHAALLDGLLSVCHPDALPILLFNASRNDSLDAGLAGGNHGRLGPFCSFCLLQQQCTTISDVTASRINADHELCSWDVAVRQLSRCQPWAAGTVLQLLPPITVNRSLGEPCTLLYDSSNTDLAGSTL